MALTPEAAARRAVWRARLLSYAAAGLDGFGAYSEAAKKRGEAELHQLHATLLREYEAARVALQEAMTTAIAEWPPGVAMLEAGVPGKIVEQAYNAVHGPLPEQQAFRAKRDELRETLQRWRHIGELMRTRGIAVLNDFAEPSDDELLADSSLAGES